jgi:hypothetical protein
MTRPVRNSHSGADAIARCRPSDFDGHSEFGRLDPDARLDALAAMARFALECRGVAGRPEIERTT